MRRPNPYRCAWLTGAQAAITARFSTLYLFNNSSAAELLAVHAVSVTDPADASFTLALTGPPLGGLIASAQATLAGEPTPPGQIYAAANPAVAPASFAVSLAGTQAPFWPYNFPICVLQPNSSLLVASVTLDLPLTCSFWYEAINPEQLGEYLEL
jgi:hypothetical protein